jgi:hypothetical protein
MFLNKDVLVIQILQFTQWIIYNLSSNDVLLFVIVEPRNTLDTDIV